MIRASASRWVLVCGFAVAALHAAPAHAFHGSGNVTALAVDPVTPATVYAGTMDRGVFKSTDGGATWVAAGPANASVSALAIDPHVPSTLYALTSLGLLKSENAGGSWRDTSLMNGAAYIYGFPNPAVVTVSSLAISPRSDPATPAALYAGLNYVTSDAFMEYAWAEIWRSTDGGSSWAPITPAPGDPWSFNSVQWSPALAVAPPAQGAPAIVYASGSYDGDVCWFNAEAAWLGCKLLGDAFTGTLAFAVDPTMPQTVYAGTNGRGVYKSVDGGAAWSGGGSGTITVLAVDPRTPATVYAGTDLQGVLKSTDGGATWSPINDGLLSPIAALGLDPRINALALDAQGPSTLYAGTAAGLFKSTDGGASWNPTGLSQHSPLISLSLQPGAVIGAAGSTGTVLLNAPAPEGGVEVLLASSDPAVAVVPPSVRVAAGATSATFEVSSVTVPAHAHVTISATLDDLTKRATLVVAPALTYFVFSAGQFVGGIAGTGWVGMGVAAPPAGAVLSLSSSHPAVLQVPATLTAPAGTSFASFPITTSPVATTTMVTITATLAGESKSATVRVEPTSLLSFSVDPREVIAGSSSTGTVVLTVPAPAGGAPVRITVGNTAVATAPETVTVPAGATSASFEIATSPTLPPTYSAIIVSFSATNGGVYTSGWLRVTLPPAGSVAALSVDPANVIGGAGSTATVFLNAAAPAGGTVVALSSSNPAVATVPGSITVPAGAASASFALTTHAVGALTTVSISASGGGTSRQVQLTVAPAPATTLSSLSINPASVTGGGSSTGTALLSAAAPPGGAVVALSNSNPTLAAVPATIVVPEGSTSASFSISTVACTSGSVTVTATFGGSARSANLAVSSGADNVTIQQADYFASKRELRVAARTSGAGSRLSVHTSSGEFIGTLQNLGDGKHSGEFSWPVNPQSITVRSTLCGSATLAVRRK